MKCMAMIKFLLKCLLSLEPPVIMGERGSESAWWRMKGWITYILIPSPTGSGLLQQYDLFLPVVMPVCSPVSLLTTRTSPLAEKEDKHRPLLWQPVEDSELSVLQTNSGKLTRHPADISGICCLFDTRLQARI